ncbi:uncharacterized protein LOC116345185 isoform X2 [Contarinia nasturtii]|uniref:uncharacterized protein LOC116345185 isoform X2 n=1 Tax=Contarinia nasturtii TaxID=265458 RepID=UPI0012D4015D|nr:uncharacterized protein LOC116345185 isoform X2 [Contarinia nasturtii]
MAKLKEIYRLVLLLYFACLVTPTTRRGAAVITGLLSQWPNLRRQMGAPVSTKDTISKSIDLSSASKIGQQSQRANSNSKLKSHMKEHISSMMHGLSSVEQFQRSMSTRPSIPGIFFEPIKMNFPKTPARKGVAATKYVNNILERMEPLAKDKNLIMTGESCANGLGSIYIVKSDEGDVLYTICYNDDTSSAIYTDHIIDLATKALEHRRFKKNGFKSVYTLGGGNLNDYYYVENQTKKLNKLFIPFTDPDTKKSKYLSRNHLTPRADFTSAKHQALTYYFQNCFPGMQSMNCGNWCQLENLIRHISTQMDKVLRVFTGTYGILKKKTKTGNMMDVYLDPDRKRVQVPLVV